MPIRGLAMTRTSFSTRGNRQWLLSAQMLISWWRRSISSSWAHTSGSRSKKEHDKNALCATAIPAPARRLVLARRRLVVNGQGNAALDRFTVAKSGNETGHAKIFRGRSPETDQRRIFRND